MELVQVAPLQFLAKQTVQVLEDRVVVHHKSLFGERCAEYGYAELKPRVIRGTTADATWNRLGWILLIAAAVLSLTASPVFGGGAFWNVVIGLDLLAILAFVLRLLQPEFASFYTKTDRLAFSLPLSGKNQAASERLAQVILDKTRRASLTSTNGAK